MIRPSSQLIAVFLIVVASSKAEDKQTYTIKIQEKATAPKEIHEEIRKLLDERSIQLIDSKGDLLLQFWPLKELPAKATEAQIKNGLTYRELSETTILGAIQVFKETTSYRKQKIPVGVYTLRLADQPQSDDHRGTAPYTDFALLCPAADDKTPELIEAKALYALSAKITEKHPVVLLLFPGDKGTIEPKLTDKGEGHWVLMFKQKVTIGTAKGTMGIGITLIGHSALAS